MRGPLPLDTPFRLGPFTIDETGRLLPTAEGSIPAFTLRWRERVVEVTLERRAGCMGWISLRIGAGHVASTADAPHEVSQARRARAFATLRALRAQLPEGWSMELLPDHLVRLAARMELEMPTGVQALVAQVSTALLLCAPYLDVLAEDGVAPGSAKT